MLDLPIEEYFKYHPPTTPERIALHDRVNQECLEACRELLGLSILATADVEYLLTSRTNIVIQQLIALADDVCKDLTCSNWARIALQSLTDASVRFNELSQRTESIVMLIQQFCMFLNQGITIDELKKELNKDVKPPSISESTPFT